MRGLSRLNKVYGQSLHLSMEYKSKIFLASDCHRGCGDWGDNFLPNQNIFFAALQYYYNNGFTYIELGDGDELWENRCMKRIIRTHSHVFWLMSRLYCEGRLYMIAGNHDKVKEKPWFLRSSCERFYDEQKQKETDLFPGMKIETGIILENKTDNSNIFLTHGHQGDFINDQAWKLGRFLVRYFWRPLEQLGFKEPISAADNIERKEKVEKRLTKWAENKQMLLIAGHTHRPVLPKPGEGLYCNDGCCVHPRCVTGLELAHNNITLVKWSVMVRVNGDMHIGREVLEGPYRLTEYHPVCTETKSSHYYSNEW